MTADQLLQKKLNEYCLHAVEDLISALEICKGLEIDGDIPILPPEDDLISYYKKVREKIIELHNDLEAGINSIAPNSDHYVNVFKNLLK